MIWEVSVKANNKQVHGVPCVLKNPPQKKNHMQAFSIIIKRTKLPILKWGEKKEETKLFWNTTKKLKIPLSPFFVFAQPIFSPWGMLHRILWGEERD